MSEGSPKNSEKSAEKECMGRYIYIQGDIKIYSPKIPNFRFFSFTIRPYCVTVTEYKQHFQSRNIHDNISQYLYCRLNFWLRRGLWLPQDVSA